MHHDNTEAINLLKTAKGQIEAIVRMTEEHRYCVDIAKQILAAQALLKKANLSILNNHIHTCVKQSFIDGTHEAKIEEVLLIIDKYVK